MKIVGRTLLVLSIAAPSAWPAGCATPPSAESVEAPRAAPAMPGANDEALALFGQGDDASEIRFAGKSVVNLMQHTEPATGNDFDPCVDPSGRRLVVASNRLGSFSQLFIRSLAGGPWKQLTDGNARAAQPSFSPDGARIAFACNRRGQWDIWVVNTDGRGLRRITHDASAEMHPSWSPDGGQLAYCRLNAGDETGEIWVCNVTDPKAKRRVAEGLFPAWSPDGSQIAFQRADGAGGTVFSIWVISLDDVEAGATRTASSRSRSLITPAWSPDGGQVAFVATALDADAAILAICDASGDGIQLLTDARRRAYSPHWAVDGRIYFVAKERGTESIWSVRPLDGSEPSYGHAVDARRAAAVEGED